MTGVTFATQITLARILLIPVFVWVAMRFAATVAAGAPDEGLRWAAILVFGVAALSDALDGFVARRYNQYSRLGSILDPVADKLLLLAALFTLTFTTWPQHFPLWFPLLIVFRDLATTSGALLVKHLTGDCKIAPHWTGKASTATQFVAVLWIMLDIRTPPLIVPMVVAAFFTLVSGLLYLAEGIHRTQHPPDAPA